MKMKRNFFFASALVAAATLVGCSNDDNEVISDVENQKDGVAYLKVNIGYANGTATRGTSPTEADNGGFEYSTTEHEIKRADFYFYDSNGGFYTKVTKTDGLTDTDTGTKEPYVETLADPVLVIGKTSNKLPGFLLVVLNATETVANGETSFDLTGKTLTEAQEVIGSWDVANTTDGFIMTNSTYDGTEATGEYYTNKDGKYFATPVKADNFVTDGTQLTSDNSVDVYVERLAAKVTLKLADDFTFADGTNDKIEVTAPDGEQKFNITIEGWKLNATEKTSYLIKNINTTWNFGTNNSTWNSREWNDATNRRSYWAMSPNYTYNEANYGATFADAMNDEKVNADNTNDADGYVVNYFNYEELTNELSTYEYCRENAITVAHTAKLGGAATSVLVAAKISPEEGGKEEDWFLYGKTLYKTDNLLKMLLSHYPALTDFYRAVGNDETAPENATEINGTKYVSMDVADFEFYSPADGYCLLKLKDASANLEWGTITETDGTKTFTEDATEAEGENAATKLAKFNAELKKVNTAIEPIKIQGFKGGRMYYNIPIEHLGLEGNEGEYGVIRNNLYEVTINSISNIGKGVFNPNEDIIPNNETGELWQLSSEIYVLAWHIVQQGVNL